MFTLDELTEASGGYFSGGVSNGRVKGISIDSRTLKPGDAFIAVKGDNFDGHDFVGQAIKRGAKAVIVTSHKSQVASHKLPVIKVKDTTKALGDIARFHRRRFDIPVIAVTGSNGKTTTKDMAAHVLSNNFKVLKNEGTKNNHIGLPLTLLRLDKSFQIAVLEIGTNHFGEAGYLAGICEPNISIITNIGPSHLEHFGTMAGVLREKYNVVKGLKNPRICILNSDDGLLKSKIAAKGGKAFVLSFGINNGGDFSASDIISLRGSHSFYVNKKYKFTLNTPGYYNIYNALAAITAGRVFGIPHKHIASRLKTFDFPQGRLKIRVLRGIRFIDDTYNSNPLSLEQALDAFTRIPVKGKKVFVMGDMLELGRDSQKFHYEAGRRAAQCCDVFITVGPLSRMAAKAAEDAYFDRGRIFSCDTSDNARDIIFSRLSLGKGDFVLVKGSRSMKMENIFPGK